jgi:hypothetical protein
VGLREFFNRAESVAGLIVVVLHVVRELGRRATQQGLFEAKGIEDAVCIGRDVNACANFTELVSLLIQLDVLHASIESGIHKCQAAETSADNNDSLVLETHFFQVWMESLL